MRTPEQVLKEGNEGYDLRTVIDNLTNDQIIECMDEYAQEVVNNLKQAPVGHLDNPCDCKHPNVTKAENYCRTCRKHTY